jgi:hypothetical protein
MPERVRADLALLEVGEVDAVDAVAGASMILTES